MHKKGTISGIYGAYYKIIPDLNPETELNAKLRGKLRLKKNKPEKLRLRHLLTAGDQVSFASEGSEDTFIDDLYPRKNILIRAGEYEAHALGANLDRAVLIQSLVFPDIRAGFIDRFLVSCYAGNASPVIVFTKPDLAANTNPESLQIPDEYAKLGYTVFTLNLLETEESESFKDFKSLCETGVTLFAGNSGTGKSTIINRLFSKDIQKTGSISQVTGKGKHTTTNSRLFLSENHRARYIDTPGVKEWGIAHLSPEDLYASFPELSSYLQQCRYKNCTHTEKSAGCRIQEILQTSSGTNSAEETPISAERMKSFFSLMGSLQYSERIRRGDFIKATGRMKSGKIKL
ncbi:MAG: ribosome small subunit-dependent GTPase A [Spirochaetia bacterium]|nr:ribosome small subunit-dependent GTPase A [Spirochaetia bacterium]